MDVAPLVFDNASGHSGAVWDTGSDLGPLPAPFSGRSPLLHLPTELLIHIAATLDTEYREHHPHGVDPLPVLRR
jgi:hypothetical protein